MAANALPLALLAVLLPWSLYRRVRRNIGPQLLEPRRLQARIGVIAAVLVLIAFPTVQRGDLDGLGALLAGGAAGIAVAWYSLRHTRFEQKDGKDYYVPNAKIGLTLSALLIARIAYRLWQVYPLLAQPNPPPQALQAVSTPLTSAIIGLVFGYYLAYFVGILRHPARPAIMAG